MGSLKKRFTDVIIFLHEERRIEEVNLLNEEAEKMINEYIGKGQGVCFVQRDYKRFMDHDVTYKINNPAGEPLFTIKAKY